MIDKSKLSKGLTSLSKLNSTKKYALIIFFAVVLLWVSYKKTLEGFDLQAIKKNIGQRYRPAVRKIGNHAKQLKQKLGIGGSK